MTLKQLTLMGIIALSWTMTSASDLQNDKKEQEQTLLGKRKRPTKEENTANKRVPDAHKTFTDKKDSKNVFVFGAADNNEQ